MSLGFTGKVRGYLCLLHESMGLLELGDLKNGPGNGTLTRVGQGRGPELGAHSEGPGKSCPV